MNARVPAEVRDRAADRGVRNLGWGILALVFIVAFVMIVPTISASHSGQGATPAHSNLGVGPTPNSVRVVPTVATPFTTYPRTVVIETFTGEWCPYCVQESQALYWIEQQYNVNVFAIGELHVCGSTSSCGDNYIPVDGTAMARVNYYSVTGFPTVVFDGGHTVVGAASTLSALELEYEKAINASAVVPGNVSIAQTATISSSSTVSLNANVTSAVGGTYHALSYLVEYIGKNDSSQHDIGWVVRESLINQDVTFAAGESKVFTVSGNLGATWNVQHFGVITFLQDNVTKIVQNSNIAPVTTLTADLTASPTTVPSGYNTTVTVTVTNSSTHAALSGASVTMTSSSGGSFAPPAGITAADGTFTSVFTVPTVTAAETVLVSAQVSQPGYTAGSGAISIAINPVVPPTVPRGLSLTPWNQQVLLRWTAPASGGAGLTYHVYRASSPTGSYSAIGTSTVTAFLDTGTLSSQSYWYIVDAQNSGGFSVNSTAISAIAVVAAPNGLPHGLGWWLAIDGLTLNSTTATALSIHLPPGIYSYQFGANVPWYYAPDPSSSVGVSSISVQISAVFAPSPATLQGTVNPAGASVTINGTPVDVASGSFLQSMAAGTYSVEVAAAGYQTNVTMVTLTAGNTTTMSVQLAPVPASAGFSLGTLFSGSMGLALLGGIVAVLVVVGAAAGILMARRKRRATSAPDSPPANPRAAPRKPSGP
jgi:thiol-disulfide isomerase/thioredoxin